MKILTIKNKKDEDFLRKPAKKVDIEKENKKEMRDLIKEMRKTMYEANGIGLSANQVGLNKKIFIAQIIDNEGMSKFYTIVNPEIAQASKETSILEEGCLSIPQIFGPVERPEKIVLKGKTIEGKNLKIKAWGILARVFQHETDHLNGILFTDKAKEVYELVDDEQQSAKSL